MSEWIRSSQRPDSKRVLIAWQDAFNGAWRKSIGFYARLGEVETDYDQGEYVEEHDRYYLKEGWYEDAAWNDDSDSVTVYPVPVAYWCPIPKLDFE